MNANHLKQYNVKCIPAIETNGRESMKPLPEDISLYTPPRVSNDVERQKKEEKRKKNSLLNENSTVSSPSVSADYIETVATRVTYSPPLDSVDQVVTSGVTVPVTADSRGSHQVCQGRNAKADMKFTDLTHMQLKRSLDQIHGQNLRGSASSGSLSDNVYNCVQSNVKVCYSHPISDDVHIPLITPRSILSHHPEPILNGYAGPGCSSMAFQCASLPQSSKFDAVLQVKDAMLQEKEAVILKLRLQISSLQHQIQEGEAALRQVVKSHIPSSLNSASITQIRRENDIQAQRKIYELEQLLGQAECKISEKTNYFKSERKEMEEKISNLQEALKNKELSFLDIKKKHKLNLERMEKYKKRVESLERYLADLPTLEESNKLKTELDILADERESLAGDNSTLKKNYEENIQDLAEKEKQLKELEKDKNKLKVRIESLEDMLQKEKKSKEGLTSTERDEFEDLRYEVSRLRNEKENAITLLSGCEKRINQLQEKHKEEMSTLKKRLKEAQEMDETTQHGLFMKKQTSNKVHSAVVNLSSQNQQLLEEKLTLQEKVKNLEKLHSNIRESSHACSRLQRETSAAVSDLKAVTEVLLQTVNGSDPNLSALLGCRDVTMTCEDVFPRRSLSGDLSGSTEEGIELVLSNDQLSRRLNDVRKLRHDIDQLRTDLSNRCADNIGANCVTQ